MDKKLLEIKEWYEDCIPWGHSVLTTSDAAEYIGHLLGIIKKYSDLENAVERWYSNPIICSHEEEYLIWEEMADKCPSCLAKKDIVDAFDKLTADARPKEIENG